MALCSEYLDYTLQFIPVTQAVNDLLSKNNTRSHSWYRLLMQYNRRDLIRFGTVSLRSVMLNHFLNVRNTRKFLAKLKEEGKIKRVGSRKNGNWEMI